MKIFPIKVRGQNQFLIIIYLDHGITVLLRMTHAANRVLDHTQRIIISPTMRNDAFCHLYTRSGLAKVNQFINWSQKDAE